MEAIIGRDANTSQLNITVGQKVLRLGTPGCVPMSVSRQHCSLTIGDDGKMILKNLKPQNQTFVNGMAIESKRITDTDTIALGATQWQMNFGGVLAVIKKATPKTVDIRPLEAVWERHKNFIHQNKVAAGRFAALATSSGVFTLGSVVISLIPEINPLWRYVMYAIAFVLVVSTVVRRWTDATRLTNRQEREAEKMFSEYACPACHHPFKESYKELRLRSECPWCKVKFIR